MPAVTVQDKVAAFWASAIDEDAVEAAGLKPLEPILAVCDGASADRTAAVAALQATLEVLDDDAFDDPAAARHFLVNLRRSTNQLERTLADLVTLARYETASLTPDEPARMSELLQDAVEMVEPLAEATNVAVRSASDGQTCTSLKPSGRPGCCGLPSLGPTRSPGGSERPKADTILCGFLQYTTPKRSGRFGCWTSVTTASLQRPFTPL